jgi:hypothetical protein
MSKETEIKEMLRSCLKEMIRLKTTLAKDSDGNVWSFGPWYGDKPHFRRDFGHWSESVLEDYQLRREGFKLEAYVSNEKPSQNKIDWTEYYLKPTDPS